MMQTNFTSHIVKVKLAGISPLEYMKSIFTSHIVKVKQRRKFKKTTRRRALHPT